MRTTQITLIKLRNSPSTSPKSAGKRSPQPLLSHQSWTQKKKENSQSCLIVWMWRPSPGIIFKAVLKKHNANCFLSLSSTRQVPQANCGLLAQPDTAFHALFTTSRDFPDPVRAPVPYKQKQTFLSWYQGGKLGGKFRYAGQPMQFTFSDHPYIKRGSCAEFQDGLN